ncbi:hypothetical protein AYO22_07378 [Fonsecaea multimorphosa]|nr:hypothetical protein AYO22_07378 [Fonsecaea multimorphosa]
MSQDSHSPLVGDMKSIATATNAQIDSSARSSYANADNGGSSPGSSQSNGSMDKRSLFRQRVGIKPETGASSPDAVLHLEKNPAAKTQNVDKQTSASNHSNDKAQQAGKENTDN